MFKSLLVASLLSLSTMAIAQPSDNALSDLKSQLKQQFPNINIDKVIESPITGLYQVNAGSAVLYTTKNANYIVTGDIIDLKNGQKNLTEEIRKSLRLAALKPLENNLITFAPAKPKYTVTALTDVDCGYCRKLHDDIPKLNELGIAVRYVAFPRSGPGTAGFDKMSKIWCAKDKKQAFNLAKEEKSFEAGTCNGESPVMAQYKFGLSCGVNGTPTLIFQDGTMYPGYLPPEELLKAAKQLAEKSA